MALVRYQARATNAGMAVADEEMSAGEKEALRLHLRHLRMPIRDYLGAALVRDDRWHLVDLVPVEGGE
jgi:hypothetical protein